MKTVRAIVPLTFNLNEGGLLDVSAAFMGIDCFRSNQRRNEPKIGIGSLPIKKK
jgi:hypothetical protein